jgi:hypothetical protein
MFDDRTVPVLRASRSAKTGERPPLGFHLTFRLLDGRVLAPTELHRRMGARAIVRIGARRGLVAYGIADTHLHVVVLLDRDEAGKLARCLGTALKRAWPSPVPFEPARFVAIRDQGHLHRTVRYVLRQQQRHGVTIDPCHDGNSLPDVLGWRHMGHEARVYVDRLRRHVPRLDLDELWEISVEGGLPDLRTTYISSAVGLAEAGAAAFVIPTIFGSTADQVKARHACVHAGLRCGMSNHELGSELRLSLRHVQRLRGEEIDEDLVRAVGWQLRLVGRRRIQERK